MKDPGSQVSCAVGNEAVSAGVQWSGRGERYCPQPSGDINHAVIFSSIVP